jgi:hypothetical protein
MRTVSPGIGGAIICTAMVVSLAYAMGDGDALRDLATGLAAQIVAMTSATFHQVMLMVNAMMS